MAAYSVADAKAHLPNLIDRALDGEEVTITRHGKTVAELRPAAQPAAQPAATHAWLRARRATRPPMPLSTVELLDQLYEA